MVLSLLEAKLQKSFTKKKRILQENHVDKLDQQYQVCLKGTVGNVWAYFLLNFFGDSENPEKISKDIQVL